MTTKIVVIGGCGHVGLPLAMAFADRGCSVVSYDINPEAVKLVNSGKMPFLEPDADEVMARIRKSGTFSASTDPAVISEAEVLIVVIGTPVDEHLNPDAEAVPNAVAQLGPYLRKGQLLVLRSTVYPGVTSLVERRMREMGHDIELAFCPERIAEGKAFTELFDLPQIVSATSDNALTRAKELFLKLTDQVVETTPEEAELAKLFTNTWR